jgi:hypothetical protein
MNPTTFTEPVLTLYRSLDEMAANLAYVRRELPALAMGDVLRAATKGMCDEFDSALYDVRKEVRTLEDKLGMHPGEEPFDPDVVNTDPRVTLSLIETWLSRELEGLHTVVKELERGAEREPTLGAAFVLVAESGANILKAFGAIRERLKFIAVKVDEPQDA